MKTYEKRSSRLDNLSGDGCVFQYKEQKRQELEKNIGMCRLNLIIFWGLTAWTETWNIFQKYSSHTLMYQRD